MFSSSTLPYVFFQASHHPLVSGFLSPSVRGSGALPLRALTAPAAAPSAPDDDPDPFSTVLYFFALPALVRRSIAVCSSALLSVSTATDPAMAALASPSACDASCENDTLFFGGAAALRRSRLPLMSSEETCLAVGRGLRPPSGVRCPSSRGDSVPGVLTKGGDPSRVESCSGAGASGGCVVVVGVRPSILHTRPGTAMVQFCAVGGARTRHRGCGN